MGGISFFTNVMMSMENLVGFDGEQLSPHIEGYQVPGLVLESRGRGDLIGVRRQFSSQLRLLRSVSVCVGKILLCTISLPGAEDYPSIGLSFRGCCTAEAWRALYRLVS